MKNNVALAEYRRQRYMDDKVNLLSDAISVDAFDPELFCQLFTQENKMVQQTFTRLCIEWLRTCASVNYYYDVHNKASHEVAKDILRHEPNTTWYLPKI